MGTDEQEIEAFALAARQFCTLLEGQPAAEELALALAELHAGALCLQDRFPEDDAPEEAQDSELSALPLLPVDISWVYLDPLSMKPSEPGAGSLADDLGDIQRDLARGLWLFDVGRVIAACWEWRFYFHAR